MQQPRPPAAAAAHVSIRPANTPLWHGEVVVFNTTMRGAVPFDCGPPPLQPLLVLLFEPVSE